VTPDTVELCSSLAAATESKAIGSLLARALTRDWGAHAAIVWLPTDGAGEARGADVWMSGTALDASSPDEVATRINAHEIEPWLAGRGLRAPCVAGLPPQDAGRIVSAWRDAGAVPPLAGALLAVVAAHVSLLLERRQLKERLADAVAAQLEAEDQIARTRRVRALGEMASGVVHDFNNALTSILGFAELALGPLDKGDAFFSDLSSIRTAALDAAAVVRRLQSLTSKRRETDEREVVDLLEVARAMPALVRPRWTQLSQCQGVTFDIVVDAQPAPMVHVAVAEIRELLLNLLFNAVDAMPSGGRITIRTGCSDEGWAEIAVADEGVGMPDEISRQIFQPFFSTKGDRGSGLGLSVCQTIARRHGARLDVASAIGKGTTFTLRLPPAPAALLKVAPPRAAAPPVLTQAPARRVLFVDDQKDVRESVGEMLRAMGHEVSIADSGEAALARIGRHPIDVVITDLGMPGMNGFEVAQRFRVLAPNVPVVLLTGWAVDPQTSYASNVRFVVSKPVTMKALGEALAACVAAPVEVWGEKCS
jgi:signal transduction histidine kinase